MKNLLESFIVAFGMYSKIPMPRINWNEKNMKYCLCFFPVIGAVIGLLESGWYALAVYAGYGVVFRTALMAIIPVLITGGIHLDGLLDTADALSSYKSREEKLEILKDSHAGAFAVIVGISWFICMIGVLSEATFRDMCILAPGFMLSRAYSGFGVVRLKKAKNSGLLRTFADAAYADRVAKIMLVWIIVLTIGIVAAAPVKGTAEVVIAFLTFLWYRHVAYSKFGGTTGDIAGFFVQMCELFMAAGVILIRF